MSTHHKHARILAALAVTGYRVRLHDDYRLYIIRKQAKARAS